MGELQARVALEEQREEESRRQAFGLRQKVAESEADTEAARKEVRRSLRVPSVPVAWCCSSQSVPSVSLLLHCLMPCPWVPLSPLPGIPGGFFASLGGSLPPPLLHPWQSPSSPCSGPDVPDCPHHRTPLSPAPWGSLPPSCSIPTILGVSHTTLLHPWGVWHTPLLYPVHLHHPIAPSPASLGSPIPPCSISGNPPHPIA